MVLCRYLQWFTCKPIVTIIIILRHHPHPLATTGNPTLYVCNNDCTIKVYDIRTHQLNQAGLIHCSVPINYVATSIPEPTNVVAVGDGKEVFLYRKVCVCVCFGGGEGGGVGEQRWSM